MPSRSGLFVLFGALALAWTLPAAAEATTIRVGSDAAFAAAVRELGDRRGTIVLRPGRYDVLTVSRQSTRPLTIRAERGASVRWLELRNARAVRLIGVHIRSRRLEARLLIVHSRNILVHRLHIRGKVGVPAWLRLVRSHRVTIRRSDFTRCGELRTCLLTGHTSRLRLIRNHFHDCRGCDFVRGNFGPHMLIRENRFDRARRGPCGRNPSICNHQDLIELQGGRGLVVERNRFGLYQLPGGGQLYLLRDTRNVIIRNNVFIPRDPRVPEAESHVGINLGGRWEAPRNVLITHNTVLTGKPRPARGVDGSVRFVKRYASVPLRQRPILVNNIMLTARNPKQLCKWVQVSAANVILDGIPCSQRDVVGDPRLDRQGRPTAGSTLTIDSGDRRWPTRIDFLSRRRDARPDIGAYEYAQGNRRSGV